MGRLLGMNANTTDSLHSINLKVFSNQNYAAVLRHDWSP